jgi:branched-chain amino acid transport system permease protein
VKAGISFWWFGFLMGIVASGVLGFCVGVVSLKRTRGLYLGIVTLGFGKIVWLIAMHWFSLTGGLRGLPNLPFPSIKLPFLGEIIFDTEFSYYYFALAFLIITIYLIHVWGNSRFGRAVRAVSQNEDLAKSIGIDSVKYYVGAFTFSCALAGLAGVVYAHYMTHVSPLTLSMRYMFGVLVMVLVGGMNTFVGPIVGATIYVYLPEVLIPAQELRMLIFGLVVLVTVMFMRKGIYPSLLSLWDSMKAKRQSVAL